MILNILITVFLFQTLNPGDSLINFGKQLERELQLKIGPPPNFRSAETCYHYTELLRVSINKSSKVISLDLSDSAPEWLKQELEKRGKNLNFKKLDSIALKTGLRNCTLAFTLLLESEDFPCGQETKKRRLKDNFFKFKGKDLNGNIIFGNPLHLVWGINYLSTSGKGVR